MSKVDMVIKALRLERCANTIVGNGLIRGVSGGEKRRLTIGEMLVSWLRTQLRLLDSWFAQVVRAQYENLGGVCGGKQSNAVT